MTSSPSFVLYVYRNGHASGLTDVITREDRETILYRIGSQEQPGVLSLRRGPDISGPIIAFIRLATDTSSAQIVLPSELGGEKDKGLQWSTLITESGFYQKKYLFKDRSNFSYGWRNVGTALPAANLECWSETLSKKILTYKRPLYQPQDQSAKFEIQIGWQKDLEFFLATAIAMEEWDALKRGVIRKPVHDDSAMTASVNDPPSYDSGSSLKTNGSIKKK